MLGKLVHHTERHRTPTRQLLQSLIYLSTAALALVLYRFADLPLAVAILAGFVATIALATIGYLTWRRNQNHQSKQ